MDKNQNFGFLVTLCIEFPLSSRKERLFAEELIVLRNVLSSLVAMDSSKEIHACCPEHVRVVMGRNVRCIGRSEGSKMEMETPLGRYQ